MLSVGLTGGIATGKSLVAGLFVKRGAFLIDADSVAREVVIPGSPGLALLVDQFGPCILDTTGALDREKLGSVVFADPEKRNILEAILHPLILETIFSTIDGLRKKGHAGIVISDIPLLFECGIQKQYDATVLVYADPATQQQRLVARNGLGSAAALQRLSAQMSIAEKRQHADFIIENTGSLRELEIRVSAVWSDLCELLQKQG